MLSKTIKGLCVGALLGSTVIMPLSRLHAEETWQQGGLATNNVSKGTAKAQESISIALAALGLASNVATFIASHNIVTWVSSVTSKGAPPIIPPQTATIFTGDIVWGTFGFNTDLMGAALDGMLLNDAMTKKAVWSEDIPELQAQIRQMGSAADLEQECEGGEEGCNATNVTLDGTEVHIKTLKNVGLEALEDVAGSVLTTPGELIGAAPVIQQGFGSEVAGIDVSQSAGKKTASGVILWSDYFPDANDTTTSGGTRTSMVQKPEKTEKEIKAADDRKLAHLQLTGTAGVARADLGATVARSEKAAFDRLSSYVGSGDGLIANIKVLTGLDLTLSQRLNMLNMLQGQQVANEAANALQFVETK